MNFIYSLYINSNSYRVLLDFIIFIVSFSLFVIEIDHCVLSVNIEVGSWKLKFSYLS